jgi:hypothetical protein
MRTSVLVGLVAGSAMSLSAYAQDEHTLTPISLKGIVPQVVTPNYVKSGPPIVMRNIERGAPGIIFDRITTLDSYFYFGFTLVPNQANDYSMSPGPQSGLYAGGGQLITGMDIVFGSQDTLGTGRNFDMNVGFFDQGDPLAAAGVDAFSVPIDVGGFTATFTGLPAGFWIASFGFSTFPNGGLQLNDDGGHINIWYTEVGVAKPAGYTHLSGLGNISNVYNSCSTYGTTGNETAATNVYGTSNPWFLYDANANGACEAATERFRRSDSYLIPCTFTINLYGDVRCPADFTNDGFVDPLDYNGFINAFETPCP